MRKETGERKETGKEKIESVTSLNMTQELHKKKKVALLLDLLTYTTHYKSINSELPDRNLHYRGKKDWKGKNGKEK